MDTIQVNLHYLSLPVKNWRDFVGAKFYCPHTLADGNQRFRYLVYCLLLSSQQRAGMFCH